MQVYMVGDPVQLPATVMSKRAVAANFQRSLFKRLQDAGYPVHILKMQYRMNPTISHFASSTFYQGRIQDGPDVVEETERPFHKHKVLGPLTFLHVDGKETTPPGSSSICNHAECDMVLALIQCLGTQVQCLSCNIRLCLLAGTPLLMLTCMHASSLICVAFDLCFASRDWFVLVMCVDGDLLGLNC